MSDRITSTCRSSSLKFGIEGENILGLIRSGRSALAILKQKAVRNRSWFKVLRLEDRRFLDAVMGTVRRVRSATLLDLLEPLVKKLLDAIGGVRALIGEVSYRTRITGTLLAQRISRIAQSWGNKNAEVWATDERFMRYLAVVDMNNIPVFRVSGML